MTRQARTTCSGKSKPRLPGAPHQPRRRPLTTCTPHQASNLREHRCSKCGGGTPTRLTVRMGSVDWYQRKRLWSSSTRHLTTEPTPRSTHECVVTLRRRKLPSQCGRVDRGPEARCRFASADDGIRSKAPGPPPHRLGVVPKVHLVALGAADPRVEDSPVHTQSGTQVRRNTSHPSATPGVCAPWDRTTLRCAYSASVETLAMDLSAG